MGIKTLIHESDSIIAYYLKNQINVVISGGEKWLVSDLYRKLYKHGIKFFGPLKLQHLLKPTKYFSRKLILNL